jgi:CHAD domain-containing protein
VAAASSARFLADKLAALDRELAETIPRVLARADDEALHDMRVAIRRIRTILKIARPVFGRFHADSVRRAFTSVQRATGALRDEEVLEETLAAIELQDAAFLAWRGRRRARERALRRAVLRMLEAGELDRARAMLGALLLLPPKPSRDVTPAKLARKCALRARGEVEKRRDVSTSDVVGLHDLRIAFKGLRYASEILAEALPIDLSEAAKPAATMQKRLGEIHDVDVAIACAQRARALPDAARASVLRELDSARASRVAKYLRDVAPLAPVTPPAASGSGTPPPSSARRPDSGGRSPRSGREQSSQSAPRPRPPGRRRSGGDPDGASRAR